VAGQDPAPTVPRLIALSPGDVDPRAPERFLGALEVALAAGLPGVLLREPRLEDGPYLELAGRVAALVRASDQRWFALHDRAHLAPALEADAVHLSFRSLAPAELRPWLGGCALGLSTHAGDDPAAWSGTDYVFHGPLRPVAGKRRAPAPAPAPVTVDALGRAAGAAGVPLLALGGVRPADVPALRAAGVHGVAALSGVLSAPDPAAATRAYLAALEHGADA